MTGSAVSIFTAESSWSKCLERHGRRRAQGVPTLSVSGRNSPHTKSAIRRWGIDQRRTLCDVEGIGPRQIAAAWFHRLTEVCSLPALAMRRGAERFGISERRLFHALTARSAQEQALFLQRSFARNDSALSTADDRVIRTALEHLCGNGMTAAGLEQAFRESLGDRPVELIDGVLRLLTTDSAPILSVEIPPTSDASQVVEIVEFLAALGKRRPELPIFLILDPAALTRYLGSADESHARAMVREGILPTPIAPAETVAASPIYNHSPSGQLVQESDAIEEAVEKVHDGARSEAERFLYHQLQSNPLTRDLFLLNGHLTPSIGGPRREIDFLSPAARIAVELDGYFHFTDLDAYRRDRRKDLLLQQEGFLVLRFLSDDVVARMEEIMGTILHAVRQRLPPASADEAS